MYYHWGWIYEQQKHDCLTVGAATMHFDYESSLIRPAGIFVAYTALSTLGRKNRSSLHEQIIIIHHGHILQDILLEVIGP